MSDLEKVKKGLEILEEVRVKNIKMLSAKEAKQDYPDMADYDTLEMFTKGLRLIKEGSGLVKKITGREKC